MISVEKDEIIKRIIESGLILKDNSSKRYDIYSLTYNVSRANNIFFCRSTLILLLNVRRRKWRSLLNEVKEGIKETEKVKKRKRDRAKKSILNKVIVEFLEELGKQEGEAHTTRFFWEH